MKLVLDRIFIPGERAMLSKGKTADATAALLFDYNYFQIERAQLR